MRADGERISAVLRAPGDPSLPIVLEQCGDAVVAAVAHAPDRSISFPVAGGQPVLIDFEHSVVDADWYRTARASYSLVPRRRSILKRLKRALTGNERTSQSNYTALLRCLGGSATRQPLILVIGGATCGAGASCLYDDPYVQVMTTDIYPSNLTDFVADVHKLPVATGSLDAVCIQAVLEHVLEPQTAVREIYRVLKPGGLVYAETPFMQQVHEGAFDFTRFTDLGHRWLFRDFEEIARGANGGPGLSLLWSLRYLLAGLVRSRRIGNLLAAPFVWLASLDRFIPEEFQLDGANGVFFLGRKGHARLEPSAVPALYRGGQ